jgi:hypothetical protein
MTSAITFSSSTSGSASGLHSRVGDPGSSLMRSLFGGSGGFGLGRGAGGDRFERARPATVFDRHGAPPGWRAGV